MMSGHGANPILIFEILAKGNKFFSQNKEENGKCFS